MKPFNQIYYYVLCIAAFAKQKNIAEKEAFRYLHAFQGFRFLEDCYEAEHTLSLDDAVEDLTRVCQNNGGTIE
jgi:hypothetical protein